MKAVIGLGFGDEGKGTTVDYLCSQTPNPIVCRFSGGHQAGHTVVKNGLRHVFSNFGSGTLSGAETHLWKDVIVSPVNMCNEYIVLKKKGITPKISIHPECMITTPYDFAHNNVFDKEIKKHGTCGMGIGATVARNEALCSLRFKDLFSPTIFDIKMEMIKQYYNFPNLPDDFLDELEAFKKACAIVVSRINTPTATPPHRDSIIFEGSQGLLLDKDIGFFPHVTRANTGSKNLVAMGVKPEYWLVTRAYQTRHGNGPMTNENKPHKIKLNPNETNVYNIHQGNFRKTLLDLDLLRYSLDSDKGITRDNLVITCLDHIVDGYKFTLNQDIVECSNMRDFVYKIKHLLHCQNVYISQGEESSAIKKL